MALAAIDPLCFEGVQLLADCFSPLFVTEIPIVAEALIPLGLLRAFPAIYRTRTCFFLSITEMGRSYVETWIGQHGKHKHRKTRHRRVA
jgi:hypothetical protein